MCVQELGTVLWRENTATGETSQAITPFHFFDNFVNQHQNCVAIFTNEFLILYLISLICAGIRKRKCVFLLNELISILTSFTTQLKTVVWLQTKLKTVTWDWLACVYIYIQFQIKKLVVWFQIFVTTVNKSKVKCEPGFMRSLQSHM